LCTPGRGGGDGFPKGVGPRAAQADRSGARGVHLVARGPLPRGRANRWPTLKIRGPLAHPLGTEHRSSGWCLTTRTPWLLLSQGNGRKRRRAGPQVTRSPSTRARLKSLGARFPLQGFLIGYIWVVRKNSHLTIHCFFYKSFLYGGFLRIVWFGSSIF